MPKVSKVFKWRHMLPNTYQRVEYIENSGTQYINTGVYPNPDYTTEVKFQNTSFSTFNSFFGCRNGSNARYYARNDIYDYVLVSRSYSTNSGYEKYTASTPKDYNVHTFKLSRYLYIDGTLVKTFSATQSSTVFPYSIYLFCISSEGTATDFMMGKIFYCKIWNDSGTLIRDMIPCYRKSDSVIGMYDLVNGVFYTNAGTGSFIKGSDVSDLIEYQVYPSQPTPTPTITEEYNLNSTTEVGIGKSGYKIKQIMYEESYSFSSTGNWYIAGLRTYVKGDNTQPSIYCDNYTGGTYGYDYGYGLGKYGGTVVRAQNSTESSQVSIVKINAGVTTSSKGAFKIIFTRDSVEYHYGQTAGSWTQEGTVTLSSTVSGYINTLFNNGNVYVNEGTWGGPTFTGKVTVTYEPV